MPAKSSSAGGFWVTTAPNGARRLIRSETGPSGATVAEAVLPSVAVYVQSGSEDVATRLERCPVPDPSSLQAASAAATARDAIARMPKPRFSTARNAAALQGRDSMIESERGELMRELLGGVMAGAAADEDGTQLGPFGPLVLPAPGPGPRQGGEGGGARGGDE